MANHPDQTACTNQIVSVAWRNEEGMWTAAFIGQRVDFRGLAAAGATDRVAEGPPFAPWAERWALT